MKELDLAYRTLYAELVQRSIDGAFLRDFEAAGGNFVSVQVKGRRYWYFDHKADGRPKRRYVGPADDPEVDRRVTDFKRIKNDLIGRRKLVSTLVREAALPAADSLTGDIIEALAIAGIFRLRTVRVGTVAYQTYSALLGVRLPSTAMQTGDADFAQFHSISVAVDDSVPPLLGVLRSVDASFREVPHQMDGRQVTKFENAGRYQVEFLTPNTGSDDNQGRPAAMPALGGASAEPLRFLDFLIHEPLRAVVLHKGGIPVLVPRPEHFLVHKLIVATRRRSGEGAGKRDKDILQAGQLLEALDITRRQGDLALAFSEAWNRGTGWREAIRRGMGYMSAQRQELFRGVTASGLRELELNPADYDLEPVAP